MCICLKTCIEGPDYSNPTEYREGDWICSFCKAHNFSSRRACYKCYNANPDAPKVDQAAAATMRPGDWLCAGCGAHNYASRHACFKCRNPAPGSRRPPFDRYDRGGYGHGGYDRGGYDHGGYRHDRDYSKYTLAR